MQLHSRHCACPDKPPAPEPRAALSLLPHYLEERKQGGEQQGKRARAQQGWLLLRGQGSHWLVPSKGIQGQTQPDGQQAGPW